MNWKHIKIATSLNINWMANYWIIVWLIPKVKRHYTVCFLTGRWTAPRVRAPSARVRRGSPHCALVAVMQAPQRQRAALQEHWLFISPGAVPMNALARPKRLPSWLRLQTHLAQTPKITVIRFQTQTRCWFSKARSYSTLMVAVELDEFFVLSPTK